MGSGSSVRSIVSVGSRGYFTWIGWYATFSDCGVCGFLDLNAPVDVYSEWVDACESVAARAAEEELSGAGKANAGDLRFSSYGVGDERRAGVAAAGDEDDEY